MKARLIFASVVLLFGIAVAAVIGYRDREVSPEGVPEKAALTPVKSTSWHETHDAIQLFAPPREGRDTGLLSVAFAEVPKTMVKPGGTIHLLVAVPDWVVFDAGGKVFPWADGVLLTVTNPDLENGLELKRLELNPHARPDDRRWYTLDVKVPPCTRRVALAALPGVDPGSNNAYDQVLISSREPLVFRSGVRVSGELAPGVVPDCTPKT